MRPPLRLAIVALCAIALLGVIDHVVFPGGVPRDLPFLGWQAEHDCYLYPLLSRVPAPAEEFTVCLLGSSLVAKGLHAETIRAELQGALGVPVSVHNFAIGGAYACDYLLALQQALELEPDLVVVGTSFRDFPEASSVAPKSTATYELFSVEAGSLPPHLEVRGAEEVLGRFLKRHWSLLRYRRWIRQNSGALVAALLDPGADRDRTFFDADGEVDWDRVRELVDACYERETHHYPNGQVLCLRELADATVQAGAGLLVVNMPVSGIWFERDCDGERARADAMLASTCAAASVDYADASRLYDDSCFIDSRHLRRGGALRFSRWLAARVAPYHR